LVRLNKTEEARQTLQAFIERLDALPDKHLEYVRACVQMSDLPAKDIPQPEAAVGDTDASPPDIALDWLDRAVEYMPDSAEALVRRARYYRQKAETAGTTEDDRSTLMALACKDLDTADTLGPEDPRVQCFLGAEWMAQGEFDRVAAELRVIDNLPQEVLSKYLLDISDWTVARFLLASELATRRGTAAESSSLADDTLASLTEKRHRVQVLPSAISLYVAAGKVAEARRCLDEYTTAIETNRPRQANRPFTKFGRDTASSSTKPVGEGGSSRPPYFLYKP
jgi:tetratricopeptide (TPR) repeat protein